MKRLMIRLCDAIKAVANKKNQAKVARVGGYARGDVATGTVVYVAAKYALVELPSGIVGKLGINCWRCNGEVLDLRDVLARGDEIEVTVLRADEERQRLHFGHDVRRAAFARLEVGDIVHGTVVRHTGTQILVELSSGIRAVIDGAAMRSAWGQALEDGDEIEASVVAIREANRFVLLAPVVSEEKKAA